MKQRGYFCILAVSLLFHCGCVTVPSVAPSYFYKGLDPMITFLQIYQDPDQYKGKSILVGGVISGVRNYPQKTEIEIIQKPLNNNKIPVKTAYSGGKFFAFYDGYLDRLIYSQGQLITIAGIIKGKKITKRVGSSYIYPVIMIQFHRLWPSQEPYFYSPWFQPKRKEEMSPPFWDSLL